MRNQQQVELWIDYINMAKFAYSHGSPTKATQYFRLSEQAAGRISAIDERRGVAFSWLALCYMQTSNYNLAEEMFRDAETILSFCSPSMHAREIELNLALLGSIAKQRGLLPATHAYYENACRDVGLRSAVTQRQENYGFNTMMKGDPQSKEQAATKASQLKQLRHVMAN